MPYLRLSQTWTLRATTLTRAHPYQLTGVPMVEMNPCWLGAHARLDGDGDVALPTYRVQVTRRRTNPNERRMLLLRMTPVTLRQTLSPRHGPCAGRC